MWPWKSDVALGDLVASRVETVGDPIETRLEGKVQLSLAAHPGPRSLPVENSVPVAASLVESLTISTPVSEKRQSAAPVPQPHAPRVREGSKRERPQSPGAPPPRQIDFKPLTLSLATPYDLNPFAGTEFAVHRDTNLLHATVDLENYNLSFKVGYEDIVRTTPSPDIKSGSEHPSGSSQSQGSRGGGREGRPLPEQAWLASIVTDRAAAVTRNLDNPLLTAARLEIRPAGQPLTQETAAATRDVAADKFSTAYPQGRGPNDSLEERAPGAERRAAPFPEVSRSRTGARETTSSDFVESTRPDRLPAPALPGHGRGAPTNSLETRTSGGEMTALSQPAPKPGQNPLSMPQAASSPPSASGGDEAVERLVEMATLHRQSASGQMNILLRDSRLGRLSLRLVERAGLIDTIVRSDNPRTATLINDTLPQLIESLAGRGLQAQAAAQSNGSASYGDPHQQQQGGRRQQRSFRPKQHIGRQAGSFRLEVERSG